jgi:ABC-type multidrug transport system fused ATPase/permease subunit
MIDPLLAVLVFLVCGGSYAIVYKITRRSLTIYGKRSAAAQGLRNKTVNEAFGGIKDLKLLGREEVFLQLYSIPSHDFAKTQAQRQTIAQLPKYALETIIFGGILLIILYFIGIKNNINGILPILSLYAFAGYRLMPALERIFAGLTALRFNMPVLDIIYNDIYDTGHPDTAHLLNHSYQPLQFSNTIRLKNVKYKYPQSNIEVIRQLNLEIQANTTVGFVGQTGSGKTTLIDIILGLLPVEDGELLIDDTCINQDNVRNWQKNLGYVPQHIYLADDSISNNIAFGIPHHEIDHQAVTRAAQIARLHDFVQNSLPEGYDTIVGERGVRLSGGQRQRIGIARALYHDPQILILDEATSALDGATENAIMDAIHNLSQQKTVIMIAHRITTLRECNVIHVMEKGEIIESGTFNELMASNAQFSEMANVSSSSIN